MHELATFDIVPSDSLINLLEESFGGENESQIESEDIVEGTTTLETLLFIAFGLFIGIIALSCKLALRSLAKLAEKWADFFLHVLFWNFFIRVVMETVLDSSIGALIQLQKD